MDTAYWVSLHKILYFHAKKYLIWKEYFKSPQEIWQAPANVLRKTGFTERNISELIALRHKIEPGKELDKLIKLNIKAIFYDDQAYPENLRHIYDPPALLYVRGTLKPEDRKAIAIVGARNATPYGTIVAEKIAGDLARQGICVVSGMARGIDTAAHKGALKKKGRTIAVLGCGVDVVYPAENKKIMADIASQGAVISEFPLGTEPLAHNFPIRNRIISGLSNGTVVVEAAERSGSLITADQALEQGREVFAIPGNITGNLSKGPHKLIKQGAKMVESVIDILEEFGWEKDEVNIQSTQNTMIQLNLEEDMLYRHLSVDPMHIENIIVATGIASGKVSSLLMLMELKGLVRKLPGQYYVINAI